MIEADGLLKLPPASSLDMNEVFEHIDMLSMGIQPQPYTVIPILISSNFGVLDHLCSWSQSDGIMSLLKATATSNCFPYPHETYKKSFGTLICCPYTYGCSLTQFYPH
jgi:hypothetical protein